MKMSLINGKMEGLIMNKEWIMNNLEPDWDDENIYIEVTDDGKIRKYDILNETIYEYEF